MDITKSFSERACEATPKGHRECVGVADKSLVRSGSDRSEAPPLSAELPPFRVLNGQRKASVAVLFARADSVYKSLPGCDVFDIERDARSFSGNMPVIAHPPCRAWGQLRALANPRQDEKALAIFAIEQVRRCGGVLEHPARSTLWPVAGLPRPGERDSFGGWTLPIYQSSFGHRAEKPTFLYIVGCEPSSIPPMPFALGAATHICGASGRRLDGSRLRKGDIGWRPEITKAEREHTPAALAFWLFNLALEVAVKKYGIPVIPVRGVGKVRSGNGSDCSEASPLPASGFSRPGTCG